MSTFEIVRGVEGDCLVLDGTRICGSKPWGGGRIIKHFETDGIYEVIDKDEYHKLLDENAKLRELVRGLHMAYVGALNECEGMDAGLIWDHCDMVDAELAKSHERFEADRHRFDVAMRELEVEVDG